MNKTWLFMIVVFLAIIQSDWGGWNVIAVPIEVVIFGFIALIIKAYKEAENKELNTPSSKRGKTKNKVIKVNCALHITYEDGEGKITERDIHIFSYEPKSQYIQARDSIAKASRTFRIDRIQEATDLETGELIKNGAIHSWILERQ